MTQGEINLMNEGKELAEKCKEYLAKVDALAETDKRCSALAKTNLQQGFMWAVRSVARPESF